ncbi:MAG TPA: amidohydrolase family protein [Candidatus Acidoferrales bacterium]|nr:amidohydrolase family protein [Candidatus Acidoferrales bacterium]
MAKTIDIHNHGYSKKFIDCLRRGEGERYGLRIASDARGEALLRPDGIYFSLQPKRMDYAAQLDQLGTAGIEAIALSTLPYVNFAGCDEKTVVWACQRVNDGLAEVQQQYAGRIYGMGMVPLPHGRAAAEEVARASRELGLRSVQILSNTSGRDLDDPEFLPFFEKAEETETLILVHPNVRGSISRLNKYYLQNLIGNPFETSLAIASVIFSGILERFPKLKILFAHGGGVGPALIGRWRHGYAHRQEPRVDFAGSVDEMFGRIYVDTVVYDPKVLRFLVDLLGAEHVLMGTDYSGDMSCWREVPQLRELDFLSASQKEQILGGNAARLLRLN